MKPEQPLSLLAGGSIPQLIQCVRGQRVMLDADLARIYGVQTRALNQAIKRNLDRFPGDFAFDLSREEILRMSQSVISLPKLRFSKRVRAFTEHGAVMAAMVLSSPRAVAMSVYITRAIVAASPRPAIAPCATAGAPPSPRALSNRCPASRSAWSPSPDASGALYDCSGPIHQGGGDGSSLFPFPRAGGKRERGRPRPWLRSFMNWP